MSDVLAQLTALYNYAQSIPKKSSQEPKHVWVEVGDLYEALRISDEGDFYRVLLGYREGSHENFVGAVMAADFNKATGLAHKTHEATYTEAFSEEACPQGAWRSVTKAVDQTFVDMPDGINLATRQLTPVYIPEQAEVVFRKIALKIHSAHLGMMKTV